jgi:molecular chaperone DnaK
MNMATRRRAFGIDLGTTLSAVAQVDEHGQPVVLPNSEGSPTTPSVVLFDGDQVVVGSSARDAISTEPDLVVQLVKRQIGSRWVYGYGGVDYGAEHISALILRKLIRDAQLLAGTVTEAVIAVPAYFSDSMRLATRRAGELAGIEVLGLLAEPTAAAIAYGYDQRPAGALGVVIDLGGGTFDVTVMRYEGSDLTVLATGGDAYLGGANFDKIIFDYFALQFAAETGLDVNDPDALSIEEFSALSGDWLTRATRAKHDLSTRERSTVSVQAAGRAHRFSISRDTFVDLSRVLLDEITEMMIDVMKRAGLHPSDADVVLAVGGSTRMPMVRQRIRDVFGQEPNTSVRPDEAVAMGAALYAARRQVELGQALLIAPEAHKYLEDMHISDVCSHSLGVSAYDVSPEYGGRFVLKSILKRDTQLPCEASRTFYTARENETSILIPIMEGDEPDPELARRIGQIAITDLPAGRPALQPVSVTMRYDQDGILQVKAMDVVSQQSAAVKIDRGPADVGTPEADASVRSLRIV